MTRSRARRDRAEAGEALAMILVVFVILFVVAVGVAYTLNQDLARLGGDVQTARAEAQRWETRFEEATGDHQALADAVGHRDATIVTSKTDVDALRAQIESAKTLLGPALGAGDAQPTVDQALAALQSAVQAARTQVTQLQSQFDAEVAARTAAESQVNAIETNYRNQIVGLQQQIDDAQQRYDSLETDTQRTFTGLQAENENLDRQKREADRLLGELEATARRASIDAEATIKSLAMRPLELEPAAPDGEVLEVSKDGALAYVDVGGRDGLRRGTRFEVLQRLKGGEARPRGMAEVVEVDSEMAMVRMLDRVDPFDPVLPGDYVMNPHFVRGEAQHFYLHGDYPVSLSKDFVERRLVELGAKVDDRVSTRTDVFVLGFENLSEGDDVVPLTETPEYQEADRLGVRMMRLDELAKFLRY